MTPLMKEEQNTMSNQIHVAINVDSFETGMPEVEVFTDYAKAEKYCEEQSEQKEEDYELISTEIR